MRNFLLRLKKGFSSKDREVRKVAYRECYQSDLSDRFLILKKILPHERDPGLISMIEEWLKGEDHFDSGYQDRLLNDLDIKQQKILRAIQSEQPALLQKAFRYLAREQDSTFIRTMIEVESKVKDSFLARCNLKILCSISKGAIPAILNYVKDTREEVSHYALSCLCHSLDPKAGETLVELAMEGGVNIRNQALRTLPSMNPANLFRILSMMSESGLPKQREYCARVLQSCVLSSERAGDLLLVLAGDEEQIVVQQAWEAIENYASMKAPFALDMLGKIHLQGEGVQKLRENLSRHYEGSPDFNKIRARLMKGEESEDIASLILQASFANAHKKERTDLIKPFLHHKEARVRANALEALIYLKAGVSRQEMSYFLEDDNNRVCANAILMHAELFPSPEDRQERYRALESLKKRGERNPLLSYLFCLQHLGDESLAAEAFSLLNHPDETIRNKALDVLQGWSERSEMIQLKLRDYRNIQELDEEEPLDEFLD